MRFSEWLKVYRKAVKLSQEALADKVSALGFEITGAQISNYEREYDKDQDGNPTRPKEKFVRLAAQILHRPVDEALNAAGYAQAKDPSALPGFILDIDFNAFSEEQLNIIKRFVELIGAIPSVFPKALPHEHQNIVVTDGVQELFDGIGKPKKIKRTG